MKLSKPLSVLILIASALLLSVASGVSGATPSNKPPTSELKTPTADHHDYSASSPTIGDQLGPGSTTGESKSYTYNYYYPAQETWLALIGQVAAIFSALLLTVFTGGLLWTSVKQWFAIREQAKIANRALAHQFRPRLRVRRVTFLKELEVDHPVYVSLEILNWGDTPATIVSSNLSIFIGPADIRPWRNYTRLPQPEDGDLHFVEEQLAADGHDAVIPSGVTIQVEKKRRLPLQPHEMKNLKDETFGVYVLGHLFYRDDAGEHHRTDFCRLATWHLLQFQPVRDTDLEQEI